VLFYSVWLLRDAASYITLNSALLVYLLTYLIIIVVAVLYCNYGTRRNCCTNAATNDVLYTWSNAERKPFVRTGLVTRICYRFRKVGFIKKNSYCISTNVALAHIL